MKRSILIVLTWFVIGFGCASNKQTRIHTEATQPKPSYTQQQTRQEPKKEVTLSRDTSITITSEPKYEKPERYTSTAKTMWAGTEYTVRVAVVTVPTGGGFQMFFLETEPDGVIIAVASDLTALFASNVVLEQTKDAAESEKPVAATLEPLEGKVVRAKAGPEGMHVGFSPMNGRMNLGDGLVSDLKNFGKKVVFKAGTLKVKGEQLSFEDGAYMVVRDGKLVAYGVKRSK